MLTHFRTAEPKGFIEQKTVLVKLSLGGIFRHRIFLKTRLVAAPFSRFATHITGSENEIMVCIYRQMTSLEEHMERAQSERSVGQLSVGQWIIMPSASSKSSIQIGTQMEGNDIVKNTLNIVEKKVRNLEKRKVSKSCHWHAVFGGALVAKFWPNEFRAVLFAGKAWFL